jgi:hypothetical protein
LKRNDARWYSLVMVTEARLFNDMTYLDYGVFWVTACGSHCFQRTCSYLCSGVINHKNIIYIILPKKIKGEIEVTGRRGRRRRKLPDDLKERRRYSHLKEEALDRTMWRARFGRGFGPVVRQTTEWMNCQKPRVCKTSVKLRQRIPHGRPMMIKTLPVVGHLSLSIVVELK